MVPRVALIASLFLGGFLGMLKLWASPLTQESSWTESEANKRAVIEYLKPVLKSARKVGRIYYSASCQADDARLVAFPKIRLQKSSINKMGVAAVREIFGDNKGIDIREERPGIISVWIGIVPANILQARISELRFEPMARYNPIVAISAIGHSREVESAMLKLGLSDPVLYSNVILVVPDERFPHLPSTVADVTMDGALDSVAKTFGGIVLYGVCNKPRRYRIEFAGND
jgi:hypothetical protein